MDEKMFTLADKFKNLKDLKKEIEAELKFVNSEIEQVDYELSEYMTETETQNFTRAGTMFCLTNITRASAVAGKKEELFEVLRAEGYDSLVQETVNANSLSSFVKEQKSENEDILPSWLEGLVNIYEKTNVAIRKSTKK